MKLKKIKIPPYLTDDSYKYLKLLIILAVLFLYKAFVFNADAVMTGLVNDVLVFLLMAFFLVKGHLWILPKIKEPIRLMRTVLGLNFLILILFLLNRGMDWEIVKNESHPYVKNLFLISISLVVVSIIMSILAICRELAFLKQKRSPKRTISLMLIFFSLLFFIHGFTTDRTILILAYVLACAGIFSNSFKVAWIAFLTRKEKVRLLIGLLLLFIFLSDNIAQSWGTHSLNRLLLDFSPGLLAIFRVILIYAGMYSAVVFYTTLFNLPTAEVFQRKVSEADSLKELNQLLARLLDFNELAGAITGMTARVLHSSWAWLVTAEPSGFRVEAADNISHDEAGEITRLILEAGVLPEKGVFMLNQKTIENLDLRLNDSTPLKTLAVAPLKADNKITGYLIAGCMEELGFDEDDKQIVQAFAHQAAVGLERAKLLDERLEKEKLEKEMELARDIQQKILPQNIPQVEGFDIAAYFSPAYEVGGDYYDFFPLTSSKLGFVIADVSGKGVSAALIMAEVKGIFESLSSVIDSPSELMSRANEILKSSLDRSRFVTVIYGVVDLVAGTLCFARAGHTPLLLYSAGTGEIRHLQPRGVGLGLLSGQSFPARLEGLEVPVQPGDIIVLYTDGISESKNDSMEDFGQQRLEEGIKINPDRTAAQLVEAINEAVTVFSRHQPQHDDITLIILKIENNR